jgi:hypothetical protein
MQSVIQNNGLIVVEIILYALTKSLIPQCLITKTNRIYKKSSISFTGTTNQV